MSENVWLAFSLTLLAGLATGAGGALAFVAKKDNMKLLSVGLGFSAGVMIYVSFVEILRKAELSLTADLGPELGPWAAVGCFFVGMLAAALLDKLVPPGISYHEMQITQPEASQAELTGKLERMGLLTAFVIAMHNFPEGMATFIGALEDPTLGVSLAIAIAIHNIPEGMSVALPIFYATRSKLRGFSFALLSGLAEPIGGIIGYFILRSVFSDGVFGVSFAAVAGIMVYISLDELLPMSRESHSGHASMLGLVLGMMAMAVSLLLF